MTRCRFYYTRTYWTALRYILIVLVLFYEALARFKNEKAFPLLFGGAWSVMPHIPWRKLHHFFLKGASTIWGKPEKSPVSPFLFLGKEFFAHRNHFQARVYNEHRHIYPWPFKKMCFIKDRHQCGARRSEVDPKSRTIFFSKLRCFSFCLLTEL